MGLNQVDGRAGCRSAEALATWIFTTESQATPLLRSSRRFTFLLTFGSELATVRVSNSAYRTETWTAPSGYKRTAVP
jgi:hypothetical protein